MALEDRIDRLENEFTLLKNEIQSVLLNIQEQVLAHRQLAVTEADAAETYRRAQAPQRIVVQSVPPSKAISEEELADQEKKKEEEEATSPPPAGTAFSRDGEGEETAAPARRPSTFPRDGHEEEALFPSPGESGRLLEEPAAVAPIAGFRAAPSPVTGRLDVATVVGLAKWVDQSTKRIGCRRTVEIVEIYDMAGHLAPEIKEVLLRFISLNDAEDPRTQVPMREVMINMLRLDRILGRKADAAAVLALFVGKEE